MFARASSHGRPALPCATRQKGLPFRALPYVRQECPSDTAPALKSRQIPPSSRPARHAIRTKGFSFPSLIPPRHITKRRQVSPALRMVYKKWASKKRKTSIEVLRLCNLPERFPGFRLHRRRAIIRTLQSVVRFRSFCLRAFAIPLRRRACGLSRNCHPTRTAPFSGLLPISFFMHKITQIRCYVKWESVVFTVF